MHPHGQVPHILIVNHAPDLLVRMCDLFGEGAYRVTPQSHSGLDIDAVAAFAPDVIILDALGPQPGDERILLGLLNVDRRTRSVPVIVCMAAVAGIGEMDAHLHTPGIRVVYEPFDIDDVLAQLRAALDPAGDGSAGLPGERCDAR